MGIRISYLPYITSNVKKWDHWYSAKYYTIWMLVAIYIILLLETTRFHLLSFSDALWPLPPPHKESCAVVSCPQFWRKRESEPLPGLLSLYLLSPFVHWLTSLGLESHGDLPGTWMALPQNSKILHTLSWNWQNYLGGVGELVPPTSLLSVCVCVWQEEWAGSILVL